jgi:hypothetical protein
VSVHAGGDASTLLGQLLSLLVFLSLLFSLPALLFVGQRSVPGRISTIGDWSIQHFLIATTVLLVGLFAVLTWNSIFPDKRDLMGLAPLPVRTWTLFLAKVAAVGTALGLLLITLHALAGLIWPFAFGISGDSGFLSVIRAFAAYWITMLSAGVFLYCSVLGLQGLVAELLPRQWLLRFSSLLQLAVFCLLISVYFLQSMMAAPNLSRLSSAWSPSYWFLGLFQQLNGSRALASYAERAWIGLSIALGATTAAYSLCYFRSLRKIVEEPDILPGIHRISWLPGMSWSFETAIVQFSARTLLRSRHHRMILAFYMGIGFGATVLLLQSPIAREILPAMVRDPYHEVSPPLLAASIILMGFWVVGMRAVFSLPLDLPANWIFRLMPVRAGRRCVASMRRSLWMLAVVPAWGLSAIALFTLWPWRPAMGHLVLLPCLESRSRNFVCGAGTKFHSLVHGCRANRISTLPSGFASC